MIYLGHNNHYAAISFDTTIFNDLHWFLQSMGLSLLKINPYDFLNSKDPYPDTSLINLVTKDKSLREQVSNHLNKLQQVRFSYCHVNAVIMGKIGQGNFLYPHVQIGAGTEIEDDVIALGFDVIGHNAKIQSGCIIDSNVIVGGSATIGQFCHLHTRSLIYDKVSIVDKSTIGANSIVRKNILESGTYVTVASKSTLKKIS
jgi:acetyltransferase-like isoleucine patch superfamily enzyme